MEKYLCECEMCVVDDNVREELCPVCLTQRVMRGKWKLVIIFLLKDSPLRFNELRKMIPKVTQAYLSSQLKELAEDGIIIRKSYNVVPPKVEYTLSDEGREFLKVVTSMGNFGMGYISKRM